MTEQETCEACEKWGRLTTYPHTPRHDGDGLTPNGCTVEDCYCEGPGADDTYGVRQWDGSPNAVIESETSPWIQDSHGIVMQFGDTPRKLYGTFVSGSNIQRDDEDGRYPDDLSAALGLAKVLTEIFDDEFTVWYNGA